MKIGLGTAQWGMTYGRCNTTGVPHGTTVKKIIDRAHEDNIRTLDTAYLYGSSEEILGAYVKPEMHFNIVTKLPDVEDLRSSGSLREKIRSTVERSLNRLKTRNVYGLLLHRPEILLGNAGKLIWDIIEELKSDGIASKIGVSVYMPSELESILREYKIDLVQCPFSFLDQRFDEIGLLDEMHRAGIEVHSRSVFLQGLLLCEPHEIPSGLEPFKAISKEAGRFFTEIGLSRLEACLLHSITNPRIDRVIVGCESLSQYEQIFLSSKKAAPPGFRDRMRELKIDDLSMLIPGFWKVVK